MNNLNELADLHNRRANLELVSKQAKAHGYPLLIWPEDKALLRIADLPVFMKVNQPVNWVKCEPSMTFRVTSDQQLRDLVKVDRAYSINPAVQHITGYHLVEYRVESR